MILNGKYVCSSPRQSPCPSPRTQRRASSPCPLGVDRLRERGRSNSKSPCPERRQRRNSRSNSPAPNRERRSSKSPPNPELMPNSNRERRKSKSPNPQGRRGSDTTALNEYLNSPAARRRGSSPCPGAGGRYLNTNTFTSGSGANNYSSDLSLPPGAGGTFVNTRPAVQIIEEQVRIIHLIYCGS